MMQKVIKIFLYKNDVMGFSPDQYSILPPTFKEICPVVIVQSCLKTNKPTNK